MRLTSALLVQLLSAAPSLADPSPFQAGRIESADVPATANRDYRLLVPDRAGMPGNAMFPLVVYLHGAGSKGDDNVKPTAEVFPALLAEPKVRTRFPCFVLIPQCKDGTRADGRPHNWVNWAGQKDNPPAKWETADADPSDQLRGAMLALDEVLARHPVDPRRVYLTGVSMGGSGACYWAARESHRFAAVIAACGLGEPAKAKALATVPLWLFHGSDDPVAPVERSRATAEAVKAAGGAAKLTEFTGAGHNIAGRVLAADDYAALRWLFGQKREGKP